MYTMNCLTDRLQLSRVLPKQSNFTGWQLQLTYLQIATTETKLCTATLFAVPLLRTHVFTSKDMRSLLVTLSPSVLDFAKVSLLDNINTCHQLQH